MNSATPDEVVTCEAQAGMVRISSGPFWMGSDDGGEFEGPRRLVELDAFLIDVVPVTNRQFHEFTEATQYVTDAERMGAAWGFGDGAFSAIAGMNWRSHALCDREDHPAVLVSWNDATAYARWAGKRLPTEAEWEKAASGGSELGMYPWGVQEPDGTQCNWARAPQGVPPTTAVRTFPPNAYGLYDMVGNVWQWCADWFTPTSHAALPHVEPTGSEHQEHKVRRGGAWNVIQSFRLRCANRGAMNPSAMAPNVGFRCVKSIG